MDAPFVLRASSVFLDSLVKGRVRISTGAQLRRRLARRLSGHGLEIGPLSNPIASLAGLSVEYLDLYTVEELRQRFPGLAGVPIAAPTLIGDAQRLTSIRDAQYTFVIAAHVIEHMRDPIGALAEWCRVLRPAGILYLVVPDRRLTFDMARPRTSLEHLILDYREPSRARDRQHFAEYAACVQRATADQVARESERLEADAVSIHFHVFQPEDIIGLLRWFSAHVQPVSVIAGPLAGVIGREFHLLVQLDSN